VGWLISAGLPGHLCCRLWSRSWLLLTAGPCWLHSLAVCVFLLGPRLQRQEQPRGNCCHGESRSARGKFQLL
jgi:hypothetical protein